MHRVAHRSLGNKRKQATGSHFFLFFFFSNSANLPAAPIKPQALTSEGREVGREKKGEIRTRAIPVVPERWQNLREVFLARSPSLSEECYRAVSPVAVRGIAARRDEMREYRD